MRKCQDRATGECFAIKSIRKTKVSNYDSLRREIEILREVEHPNIIKLKDVYEDRKYLHLVTELCSGGELFDRIVAKTKSSEGHFSEHDAAEIVKSILEAIEYCHNVKHICHRDLKPENFLFETHDEHSVIKIIDFGLSRYESSDIMRTKVGTPYYVAPEVLSKAYDKSCDMWSIGVISYILLCGYPPFYGDNNTEIFKSVRAGNFSYPSPEWDDISDKAKDFINSLLRKDPKSRLTSSGALEHPWFGDLGLIDKTTLPKIVHESSLNTEYKKFMGMAKLKKAALAHIATHLTHAEVTSLENIFKAIDKDGDGSLTVTELKEALANGGFSNPNMHVDIESMIEELNVEGHHSLDWKEFITATIEKSLVFKEDKIRMTFNHFDRAHRGSITVRDLCAHFGSEQQAQEIMSEIDINGDGVISYQEFHEMMEAKN